MLGGMYRMHDQIGFPIDLCVLECEERGWRIDWLEALCDCWLNDCLKFDSFVRHAESASKEPLMLAQRFAQTGAFVLARFPKMQNAFNPVDVVCRYIMTKKRRGSWNSVFESLNNET